MSETAKTLYNLSTKILWVRIKKKKLFWVRNLCPRAYPKNQHKMWANQSPTGLPEWVQYGGLCFHWVNLSHQEGVGKPKPNKLVRWAIFGAWFPSRSGEGEPKPNKLYWIGPIFLAWVLLSKHVPSKVMGELNPTTWSGWPNTSLAE